MDFHRRALLGASLTTIASPLLAQGSNSSPSRRETLILENPEGTIRNPDWFNIWTITHQSVI